MSDRTAGAGRPEIEAGLAASGILHTLLRSNAYMQKRPALALAIATTRRPTAPRSKRRSATAPAWSTPATRRTLRSPPPAAHAGKTYWSSPALLTFNYDWSTAHLWAARQDRSPVRELHLREPDNKDVPMIRAGSPRADRVRSTPRRKTSSTNIDAEWVTRDNPSLLGRPACSSSGSSPTTPSKRSPRWALSRSLNSRWSLPPARCATEANGTCFYRLARSTGNGC